MSNALERVSSTTSLVGGGGRSYAPVSRRTSRALAALEERTHIRVAGVQGDGYVQTEKVKELDRLGREAMTGQAMLARWGQTLAAGDPFIADEMKFFADIVKMGKGEVIADTIDSFCRESRR